MSGTSTPTVDPFEMPEAAPPRFRPGDVIAGRYEVLHFLGSGGSAVVYAVRDRSVGDVLALKLLRPEKRSELHLARFRREVELARTVVSPWLVRIFALEETDGLTFLTMELVEGGPLRERIRQGPLPLEDVVRFAEQMLEALQALDRHRIVHRDVKPANVLLTTEGDLKLTDFGIAWRLDDDRARLTATGMPVGTLDYLSPEQARCEPIDARADLFSFGVVLYEMLTGRVPFDAPSAVGSLLLRFDNRPPDVRELRPETPAWLARIVGRLLQKERESRYPSARDVLVDLRRRRARSTRPNVRIAAMAAMVALLFLAGWWFHQRRVPDLVIDESDYGMRAVDGWGRTLWSRKDAVPQRTVVVRRGLFARPELATVLSPVEGQRDPRYVRVLSFLDPRTGTVLRTKTLPYPEYAFPEFSPYFSVGRLLPTDLDGDGMQEVVIPYAHAYYPSYTVVHDLRRGDSRVVAVFSGHHAVAATEDVDGDGVRELIFAGISNRLGWYRALAAVRVALGGDSNAVAFTPDLHQPYNDALLWYVLAPAGPLPHEQRVTVDRVRRVFRLHSPLDDRSFAVAFAAQSAKRDAAYVRLREVDRLVRNGYVREAVPEVDAAMALAREAGDALLAEWAERVKARTLVQAGRTTEAEAIFARYVTSGDAVWDAGRAFHLAGDLSRAVEWYRRNLPRHPQVGRMKYEALEGIVLALVEMGRIDEAIDETHRFLAAYPKEELLPSWYRRYVEWRSGLAPAASGYFGEFDPLRYWSLEVQLARGTDPRELLALIDREGPVMSYEANRALLVSCRSEVLARLGRVDEALELARDAFYGVQAQLHIDPMARAHFDLVAERLARLAEQHGVRREAEAARRALANVRWRANWKPGFSDAFAGGSR